jgi:hypothetical protein
MAWAQTAAAATLLGLGAVVSLLNWASVVLTWSTAGAGRPYGNPQEYQPPRSPR